MTEFNERFEQKLEEYSKNYRVEELNDANDRTLLHIMLKTELMIEDLQAQIQLLITASSVENAGDIKKLADLLRDATGTITTIQRTLAIDRKTRKSEESTSILDYINALRKASFEFVEERLTKVYCPTCNVMVGRFSPVHGHTAFAVSFQCSQCKKLIRMRRDDRDTMYDIAPSDRKWREKYRTEIIQPRKAKAGGSTATRTPTLLEDALAEETGLILEPTMQQEEEVMPRHSSVVMEDLEL